MEESTEFKGPELLWAGSTSHTSQIWLGMVVQTGNPSAQEVEAEGALQVKGQPGQHSELWSSRNTK